MFQDSSEELAQNKLLLLYIIDKSPYAFNKDQITEYILERNLLNYFLIQEYIDQLLEAGFIEVVRDKKYRATEKGKESLRYFQSKIPSKIKNQLVSDFQLEEEKKKKESQIIGEYYEKEDCQYMVNLKLVEKEEVLFSLYLSLPSVKQAEQITQAWKDDPDSIYASIMNLFIQ